MTNYDKEKFAKEIEEITGDLAETLKRKNADYGNNVDKGIDKRGLSSLAQRLDDKLARFENLIEEGNTRQVSDEAIEDTLIDIAGYAIIGYRKIREMNAEDVIKVLEEQPSYKKPVEPLILKVDVDRKPIGATISQNPDDVKPKKHPNAPRPAFSFRPQK